MTSHRAVWLNRAWFAGLWLFAAMLVSGCATPPRPTGAVDSNTPYWSGRLALQVEADPPKSPQSFSAGFELKGSAQDGELRLFSPLGQTLATLVWAPGKASLNADGSQRDFESIDALVAHATGTAIPVGALFDWLAGRDAAVPGWQADLSQLGDGRLVAKRNEPAPVAVLRVALER